MFEVEVVDGFQVPEEKVRSIEDEICGSMLVAEVEAWYWFNVLVLGSWDLVKSFVVVYRLVISRFSFFIFLEILLISNPNAEVAAIINQKLKLDLFLNVLKSWIHEPLILFLEFIQGCLAKLTPLKL